MATTAPTWSLQARVQFIALLALCIGLAVGSVSMYHAAAVEDDQVIDERVELLATSILRTMEAEWDGGQLTAGASSGPSATPAIETGVHRYQIWTNNGTRLHRSHRAPSTRPLLPISFTGYREIQIDGARYCVFSAATPDRSIIVQVAEPTPKRAVQLGMLATEYLAVALIPFAFVLWLVRRMLQKSFRPIAEVSENLRLRSPVDASPITVENPPREIVPLIHSLNSHLRRLSQALSIESRFTSVAAHELRTPLAGIRAQAQIAFGAKNPEELRESLNGVMQGVDSTSRLIEQLIDLHRIEASASTDGWRSNVADLSVVYRQALIEFQPRAAAKKIRLKMVFDVDEMHGFEFAIWMLLRNLMGNAIQYSPAGGKVDVRIKRRDFRIVLTVDDSGPGIPVHERERAFGKFDRLGRRGGDGVGLGLSIVANVADLHQAVVELHESPLGGLRVKVQFHGADASDPQGKDAPFQITGGESLPSASQP